MSAEPRAQALVELRRSDTTSLAVEITRAAEVYPSIVFTLQVRIVPPPSESGAPPFRTTWKWAAVRSLAEYRELHAAIIAEYRERDAASVPGVYVPLFPSSANWSGAAALERGELGDDMTTVRLRTLRGKFERYTQSLLAQPWVLELEDVARFISVRLTADDPALEREPEPAPEAEPEPEPEPQPKPEPEPEPALDHGDPAQLEHGLHSEVIEKADDGLMFSLEEELHDGLLRTLTPAGGLAAEDSPALDSLDVVPTEQKEGDWCEGRRVFWPRARTEADFAIAV